MTQPTRHAPTAAGRDRSDDFRVEGAAAIVGLMEALREAAAPVVLTAADGSSYATRLWSCDPAARRLSFAADEQPLALERLIDHDEVVAVSSLDDVRLRFDLDELVLVRGPSSNALQGRLPETVFRFQRRASYRLRTPERHGPTVRLRHPSIPDMSLSLRIVDLSIGGCALLLPDDVPLLQPGTCIEQVRVELDIDARFTASLQIHHIRSQWQGQGHRLGCEWLAIDARAQRTLQRFIDGSQQRRIRLGPP